MNNHEKELMAQLEAMPFEKAREEITKGIFKTVGSPDHDLALSWLQGKEGSRRDERESESLRIARSARKLAISAIIIAISAIVLNIFSGEINLLIKNLIKSIMRTS